MKSDKGVTTTSLIIYVIGMLSIIAIIATITSFFYNNVMNLEDTSDNVSELTKFNIYFLKEIKNETNTITSQADNSIAFSNGHKFTFQDNSIYYDKIRICENVKKVQFSKEVKNSKTIVKVLITLGENLEYTKTMEYVLANTEM